MVYSEKTKACLAWLNKNYNLASLSVTDIINLSIEWNKNDAMENAANCYEMRQKQKNQEELNKKEEAKSRIDFDEEIDDF